MRRIATFIFFAVYISGWGQSEIKPTTAFTISGQIKKEIIITLSDLTGLNSLKIDDLVITNHLGVHKGTARGLKGIPVKEILKDLSYNVESPRILNEFYLTFIASDGYKVVYSWNEIFNNPSGDRIFLVTEKEGKPITDMEDRILMINTSDFKTGRRHLKGLDKIRVGRVE